MKILASSVGDPGCLSRILIYINSRILDLGSQIKQQQKGKGKFFLPHLFWSHKFQKIENYFIFEQGQKFFLTSWQRIMVLFTPKLSLTSQEYGLGGILDRRSGKNQSRIQGSKNTPDPGSATHKSDFWIGVRMSWRLHRAWKRFPWAGLEYDEGQQRALQWVGGQCRARSEAVHGQTGSGPNKITV